MVLFTVIKLISYIHFLEAATRLIVFLTIYVVKGVNVYFLPRSLLFHRFHPSDDQTLTTHAIFLREKVIFTSLIVSLQSAQHHTIRVLVSNAS